MPYLVFIFVVAVVLSLCLVIISRATHKHHRMTGTHDLETAYVTSVTTLYGIFIAFMIFTVWSRYDLAETSITIEANNVAQVFRMAGALPDPHRAGVQKLALDYANSVVNDEWDTMLHGKPSPHTELVVDRMWALCSRLGKETNDPVLHDHLLTAVTSIGDHRRMRLLWSRTGLSHYAYAVLFVGALITICLSALFVVDSFAMHLTKVASLAALIGLMLATVWALGHPFRGALRLEPLEFKQVINMITQHRS